MTIRTIETKLEEYNLKNVTEQENALQEVMQHYILASLSRAGFFKLAMFHGGTCLRIVNKLPRFSEDLDFLLKEPNPLFNWEPFLDAVKGDCANEGIEFEIQDKSQAKSAVRKAFLKTDSVGKILLLRLPFERHNHRKLRIKLEVDTNPPQGSICETSYITFPATFALTSQTLESSFALKLHALLCRSYTKGRDWFDFVWYVARAIKPNIPLLQSALMQQGPWQGKKVDLSSQWLHDALSAVIGKTDWNIAKFDVQRFLPHSEQQGLQLWNQDFFMQFTSRLKGL